MPWRVAFALQDDGWWLRADNIWAKPNPMPESVTLTGPREAMSIVFLLAFGRPLLPTMPKRCVCRCLRPA